MLNKFRQFIQNTNASIAMIGALALIPMTGLIGGTFDMGKIFIVKSRLQSALDAAGHASVTEYDIEKRAILAQKYCDANCPPGYLGIKLGPLSITENKDGSTTIKRNVKIPTNFIKIAGIDVISIPMKATIQRALPGAEISFIIETSQYMGYDSSSKIQDCTQTKCNKMQQAKYIAKSILDKIYQGQDSYPNLNISLVPYANTVNIGQSNEDWTTGVDEDLYGKVGWKGCVMARFENKYDTNDATPLDEPFEPYLWPSTTGFLFPYEYSAGRWSYSSTSQSPNIFLHAGDNNWQKGTENESDHATDAFDLKGPNMTCPQEILPLTNKYQTVINNLTRLNAYKRGSNLMSYGLAWGWRTLSPDWRGIWETSDSELYPTDYQSPNTKKIAILITDGNNSLHDYEGKMVMPKSVKEYESYLGTAPVYYLDYADEKNKETLRKTRFISTERIYNITRSGERVYGVYTGSPGSPSSRAPEDSDFTAYGRLNDGMGGLEADTLDDARKNIISKLQTTCDEMKGKGILIYIINLGDGSDSLSNFKGCASKPEYYFDNINANNFYDKIVQTIDTKQ